MKNDITRFFKFEEKDSLEIFFVVILCKVESKWVLVKHKDRELWEIPGGKIDQGESYLEAAKRELYEETGALEYSELKELYGFEANGRNGLVYYTDIKVFGELPESEMELVETFETLESVKWVYETIQPYLIKEYEHYYVK